MWRHRSSRRRHRVWSGAAHRRRRWSAALIAAAGGVVVLLTVVVLVGAWRDVSRVRTRVTVAAATLERVSGNPAVLRTPEGRIASLREVDGALASLEAARKQLYRSLPISVVGAVPGLHAQRSGLLLLVDDAASAVSTSRTLLAKVNELAGTAQLKDGTIPMAGLRELETAARTAADGLAHVTRGGGALWGELGQSRRRFDETARSGADRLASGADAVRAARSFMGEAGVRRYLVAVQNNAEMRDQGMVLSYVLVSFDGGRLAFGDDGSVDELRLDTPAPTVLPPGTSEVFGILQPTRVWQAVNATADFPLSGQIMRDMYRQARGEEIDGVIAIDVPGLAALLRVVGPVTVPGIAEPVSAANAPRILLHDLYQGLPPLLDDPARAGTLSLVTKAVIERLTTGARDAVTLGRELGEVAKGGHLRLWSTTAGEEEVFERTGLGGGPAVANADRTFHLAVENRTATKLDYYVKPSVRQAVELSRDGAAVIRTTVVLDNQAPAGEGPSYQLGPDQYMKQPGDYLAWLLLWGPAGSTQSGKSVEESGLNLSERVVLAEAGKSREVTFETTIPDAVRDGRFELRLVPQPRLYPVPLEVELGGAGWEVSGEPTWRGDWDRVLTLSWAVQR